MKKQLLIAAVAATMTSVAMADISISGKGMVKYTNVDSGVAATADTNTTAQEMDLTVTGKSGDTTAVMTFNMDGAGAAIQGDAYLTTSIAGVSLKAGQFEGGKSNLTAKSARADKVSASMEMGGVKVTYENNATNTADALYLSGSVSGVNATFKKKDGSDEILVDTTIAGVGIAYRSIDSDTANKDISEFVLTGSVSGFDVTYASADADSLATINGDGIYGDINSGAVTASTGTATVAGTDLTAIKISTTVAGNTVSYTSVESKAILAANSADVDTIAISRSLAGGTTLNAKYVMKDHGAAANANDSDTLEVKLSVAF
jgi:hypothetical protein